MDQDTLPKDYTDIVNRMDALQARGSQNIAHLIVVCYWLYGYLVHVGPSNIITRSTARVLNDHLQTIDKILRRVIRLKPERAPVPSFKQYPKPHLPHPHTNSVPNSIAREWVSEAVEEIEAAKYLSERCDKSREKVENLWCRGVSNIDLEPVIQLVVDLHAKLEGRSSWSAQFDRIRGAEALMKMGEWEKGLSIFGLLSIEESANIAKILIQTGRLDLAERLLSDVKLEIVPMLPTRIVGNPYFHIYRLAEAWAYLGREDKTREVGARIPEADRNIWSERWLANVVAIGLFYQTGDLSHLMTRFFQLPKEIESPKERLSQFILLLQVLLDTAARPEIESALNIIRETLLDPDWDIKYRLRLDRLLETLWPYHSDYSDLIYQFASQLLIDEAERVMTFRGGFGDGIVTIDCLRWFVWHWAGVDKVKQAMQVARDWRKELRRI